MFDLEYGDNVSSKSTRIKQVTGAQLQNLCNAALVNIRVAHNAWHAEELLKLTKSNTQI